LKNVKGVKRYAKQFISSVDIGQMHQAIEQLNAISSIMEKDRSFKNLMISPLFSEDERQKTIGYIAQKLNISEKVVKYLHYLSDSKAMIAMPYIVTAIRSLYLEMKKRSKAVVTSPVQISKDYEAMLVSSLKEITGRDIDLEFLIDPSLLGGIRIKVGSTMYDSSIKGQLGLLKDKLIKY
jgi:ATP synthase F1 delta subunit